MSTINQREQIEKTIRDLENLKAQGLMPAEQADASIVALKTQLSTYQAKVEGSGASAQVQDSMALGQQSVGVKGNVKNSTIHTGDTHVHIETKNENIKVDALECSYLNMLFTQASQLPLEGIDPQAASEAEKRLSLHAVYTALLTLSPEAHDRLERGEMPEREDRRRSALQELNDHAHLVLLGDPGSGKSTFVNFVAMCLAGERLGREDIHLPSLTMPLPDDKGKDREDRQPWEHDILLPVRVILRDLAAHGLPKNGTRITVEHLWIFLQAELAAQGLGEYALHLRRHLLEQGGLILFDGLDEVPEADRRREQVIQLVEAVKSAFPKCRMLVTSRIYAYRRQDWALSGFSASVLAPFSSGQIIRFVDRWYAHIASLRDMDTDDAQGRAELLKRAIFASDRLQVLAERPLLLTLMASLHAWRGGSLPEKREQLYSDAVDLLLDRWERRRVEREADGTVRLIQPGLAEFLKVNRDLLRQTLNRLAFDAHTSQPDLAGTADILEKDLVYSLFQISGGKVSEKALVAYLRDRAGLLVPRGVGVYTFPHRTFQEYLAACHLTDDDYPDKVAALAKNDPNRWREVTLLAGAKAARGASSTIWNLAEALCLCEPGENLPNQEVWGAHLAGQALAESADLHSVSERNQPKLARAQRWLVTILERSTMPASERAQAGDTLAALGDPRFDPQHWYLPHGETLGFIHIPAGPFIMGSDPQKDEYAQDEEQPQHEVTLPEFWIAKYPLTVAQWRAFVNATGYDNFDKDALRDPRNRPTRWLTWYNAIAYCEWLQKELSAVSRQRPAADNLTAQEDSFWRGLAKGKLHVTLPSEAEWEKAARGSLPSPLKGEGPGVRVYPWGDEFSHDHANAAETGIGTTTAVGSFPLGASFYGVLDMSGNVWEWTRNLYGEYPYPNTIKGRAERENLEAPRNIPRVLRGGSVSNYHWNARCARRRRNFPSHLWYYLGFRVVVSP